jgi:hypothetical protein
VDYNPHAPQNVGMEWVPIQQADFVPDSSNEYGYLMRIDTSATVVSGGIGVNALPPQTVANIAEGLSIYPASTADRTGPIRMVTIPVQSGTITGTAISVSSGGGTVAQVLANPLDNTYIQFLVPISPPDQLGLNFGVTAFANELSGKRIVFLRLVYTAAAALAASLSALNVKIARAASTVEDFTYQVGIDGFIGGDLTQSTEYSYLNLGDWNPTWGPGISTSFGDTIFPWRYDELANLDTATPINVRQQIIITAGTSNVATARMGYMALQVFYCEETRVAYGGRRQLGIVAPPLQVGENRVPIRSTAYANTTVLAPGTYIVTATHRAVSNFFTAKLAPTYAGIRQFNTDPPPVVGYTVKPTIVIGDEFNFDDEVDVLTDLSLYTAVAAVTGTHVYANQLQAPVYGTITATQDIVPGSNVSANTRLAQVRYYARRFGSTTTPLLITVGSATASITVADFDALDEIFDGWREVTLPLSSSVSVTGGATFTAVWSSTAETSAGNQWQVIGATAFTSTPNSNVATYGAPNGGTVELTWKSPNVTVSTIDAQSDATVIFAQDPPTVTNFTISAASQAVTGIGTDACGVVNDCIPSAIKYLNLTWSAVSVTGSYFEIQRMDTVDTDWQQVAYVSTATLNFKDYEARVGVLSSYRIRTCDALTFCGPWVTGSGTVPTPGVTVSGDGVGVLIFTSNRAPLSNLAYTMVWNGQPTEVFVFPEADSQVLQKMYGRDFQIAFRPLERGGEQFERIMLVQAAAVPLPSLANIRTLRDLAWADLPYVCVRDELGNRWYANVLVPAGEVQRGRRIYLAQVRVTEVTDTPAPVTS